jgi:hypothetical protein
MKAWQLQMDFGELAKGRPDKGDPAFIAKGCPATIRTGLRRQLELGSGMLAGS